MNHSVEVSVYWLPNSRSEEYEELDLEVTFDFNEYGYEVTGYYLDGREVDPNDLKEDNSGLDKKVNTAIDDYIANYGEDYSENDDVLEDEWSLG